jgi:hypothetical protein
VYLGTAFLSSGTARISINSLPYRTGTYVVTATYSGDTYNNTEIGTEQVTLTKANTLTTASGPSTVVRGSPVSINVTVTRPNLSGTPSGTVYLEFKGNFYASATLSGGTATITADTTGLPLGAYPVEVLYAGDVNNNVSTSSQFTVTVTAN